MRRPRGLKDHYEQLRPAIVRSAGSTPSEQYLAKLAESAFLDLWSFPNPYRDQKLAGSGNGDGKELCDLLVVCDPHVIIFSEKNIRWTDAPVEVAWGRWFRKAVLEAAMQINGAARWIRDAPERIYLDAKCTIPFPLDIPNADTLRVHRIVVVSGASQACQEFFEGGTGSFVIQPRLTGRDHLLSPFCVGDLDPRQGFVHVFDEVALDVVMTEMDTITDFTDYLDRRAAFIRSGNLEVAHGEEDLLAYYSIRVNEDGDHDFVPPEGRTWEQAGKAILDGTHWKSFVSNEQYWAKKEADKVSYAWDRLISIFTQHLLGGTSIVLPGFSYSLKGSERAVRYMALERRFRRRSHGRAILGAMEIGRHSDSFFRAMIAPENSKESETGFFILTLKFLPFMEKSGGYEKYREARTTYLETYAISLLRKHPHLKRVVGIATEPPGQKQGSSEDSIYVEQHEWDDETLTRVAANCEILGIMRELRFQPFHENEFPQLHPDGRKSAPREGNRKKRRAQSAMNRGKAR